MSTRSIVPFGPQHPVLPEPIHLDLVLEDEKVVEAVPSIGFVHRGLEKLVEKSREGKNPSEVVSQFLDDNNVQFVNKNQQKDPVDGKKQNS